MDKKFNNKDFEIKTDIVFDDSDLEFAKKLKKLYEPSSAVKEEVRQMKKNKNNGWLKVAIVAGVLVITLPFTSFGQEIFRIIKVATVPSGRVQVVEEESSVPDGYKHKVEEGLKGKLFDKDGNEITEYTQDQVLYTKDGKKIAGTAYDENTGEYEVFTEEDFEEYKRYEPVSELKEELSFNPFVLGDKYEYGFSELFKEGTKKSDYLHIFYKLKGKDVLIFQRVSSPENGYVAGYGTKVFEKEIDGTDVIYAEKFALDFEKDGLLVTIQCDGASYEELVQIFRDLKRLD